MKIFRALFLLVVFLLVLDNRAYADSECNYDAMNAANMKTNMPFSAPLKRGINLTHWWEDETDRKVSSDDILRIHSMGFDFVRIPLSPKWLEIQNPAEQKEKLRQLRCDIVSILDEGMPVILTLHPSPVYEANLIRHPEEITQRIEGLWTTLQPVAQGLPAWLLYLGLYDEPQIEAASWWRLQEKIISDIRPIYADNTFVLSPGPMNKPEEFDGKKPYDDKNVLYDFHFYEPTFLTRHGADFLSDNDPDKDKSPIVYPVDANFSFDMQNPNVKKYVDKNWSREPISTAIKTMAAWRDHYNVKAACLSFGFYRGQVDDKSRYNWLQDVRSELEATSFPWAIYEYRGPYGFIDSQGHFDNGMLKVLVVGQ